MNFGVEYNWRNKRRDLNHHLKGNIFNPMHYSISNYCTEQRNMKNDLKAAFSDEICNLPILPNLDKNLADTLITSKNDLNTKTLLNIPVATSDLLESENIMPSVESDFQSQMYSSFASIGTFISGVFSVISGGMFQKRKKSTSQQFYDCCDGTSAENDWQTSKIADQNKSLQASDQYGSNSNVDQSNMTTDCHATASHCEDKINSVHLVSESIPITSKYEVKHPNKVIVDPESQKDKSYDACSTDDIVHLANDGYIECISPFSVHEQSLFEIDSPNMKIKTSVQETMEIVNIVPEVVNNNKEMETPLPENSNVTVINNNSVVGNTSDIKEEIVLSCEEKLNKLKAMLQERRNKNTRSSVESVEQNHKSVQEISKIPKHLKSLPHDKVHDKHFKNPHRLSAKRCKSQIRQKILEDMIFANEIESSDLSGSEHSPIITKTDRLSFSSSEDIQESDCFDEISGRFHTSSTTESEDSFQIVFTDSPRTRKVSDCESEDSFIVFEDSPDSCYTNHDVFGDDSEECDEDTDTEDDDDSGLATCKLAHNLSRTVSDLTDPNLFQEGLLKSYDSEDEVDCAVRTVCEEISGKELSENISETTGDELGAISTGLLIDEAKRLKRKSLPPKSVHFSSDKPKVHLMCVWSYAARQARAGHWEQHARDRERFKRRIADVDVAISWVLKPQHRSRVMFQRFMPWWHAQRRKEIAERKIREEEEKKKIEEEKRLEAERILEEQKRIEEDIKNGVTSKTAEDNVVLDINGENLVGTDKQQDLKNNNVEGRQIKTSNFVDIKNGTCKKECKANLEKVNIGSCLNKNNKPFYNNALENSLKVTEKAKASSSLNHKTVQNKLKLAPKNYLSSVINKYEIKIVENRPKIPKVINLGTKKCELTNGIVTNLTNTCTVNGIMNQQVEKAECIDGNCETLEEMRVVENGIKDVVHS